MTSCWISIHAPREGCDSPRLRAQFGDVLFQSTHPVRGATAAAVEFEMAAEISIHAPREGCDNTLPYCFMGGFLFQSTHPVRGATHTETTTTTTDLFQSTHPVRGATHLKAHVHAQGQISIHAPREGCDNGLGVMLPRCL